MSRVVKASNVRIDQGNAVFIDTLDPELLGLYDEEFQEATEEVLPTPEEEARDVLAEAKFQADQILDQAHKQSEEIIAGAVKDGEDQKEAIIAEARQNGYDEGYAKGLAEVAAIKQEAEQIKVEAEEFRQQRIVSVEPDLIHLVTDIIGKLLADEVEINPNVILLLIKQGLKHASLTGDVSVHVSKDDMETVTASKNEILASLETMAKIEFVEDVTLAKAQCIIETSFGSIDCSLNSQFEALKKNLFYILKNR